MIFRAVKTFEETRINCGYVPSYCVSVVCRVDIKLYW